MQVCTLYALDTNRIEKKREPAWHGVGSRGFELRVIVNCIHTSKGGNTSFAEKPELILMKITSFIFSDLLEKKLRITRNRIVIIPT